MKTFFWRLLGRGPRGSLGQCASCSADLQQCGTCEGAWRSGTCRCGLGLLCPVDGRFWMH